MSIVYTNFSNIQTVLQNNTVSFTFKLVKDRTVAGNYAKNYRYRYLYTPILCNTTDKENYISYDNSSTTWNYSDWIYIECNDVDVTVENPTKEVETIIPFFSSDVAMRFEMQVQDDGTGDYYANDAINDTPIFIALYNKTPIFVIDDVRRENSGITIDYTIKDTGLGKPSNLELSSNFFDSEGWKAYSNNILPAFFGNADKLTYVSLTWEGAYQSFNTNDSNNIQTLTISSYKANSIDQWVPGSYNYTIPSDILKPIFSEKNNTYHRITLTYGIPTNLNFEFAANVDSGIIYSDILLLPASTPTFQIKRRGIKVHMLENDSTLGTFSTGAGMFNHGEEVGVDVSGETPKIDNSKGHSIALYDTRADGDHASNRPSIGFMNDKHETMGYLKYGVASDGRPALLSNLPIIGNNQEVEDDPSVTYNMSIGLILGNDEVKTISFNGKLS